MGQDVSVSSVDLLQSYNRRIKDFSTAVNSVMYMFRNQIEKHIEDAKLKLKHAEEYQSRITNTLDPKIENIQKLIDSNNWDGQSLNILQNELNKLLSLRNDANRCMSQLSQSVDKLILQLNQLMETATTFSLSNQSLLDSNMGRVNNVVSTLNQYVENKAP